MGAEILLCIEVIYNYNCVHAYKNVTVNETAAIGIWKLMVMLWF
jgi:hypothetical protein